MKHLPKLLHKDMTRKEFIATLGLGAATIVGTGALAKSMGSNSVVTNSFLAAGSATPVNLNGSALAAGSVSPVNGPLQSAVLGAVINVRDYGAVGKVGSDDSAAVTNALAKAAQLGPGTTVYFPYISSGYIVNAITVPAGVKLVGDNYVALQKTGNPSSRWINMLSDTRITGLSLKPSGLAQTALVTVPSKASRVIIDNCRFIDSPGANNNGIETREGVTELTIQNCSFDYVGVPIFLNKGPEKVLISQNTMRNWRQRGIYVLGEVVNENGVDVLYAVSDLVIDSNSIRDVDQTSAYPRQPIQIVGIDSKLHQRVTVSNNLVVGPNLSFSGGKGTADNISLHRCSDFKVLGNRSYSGGDVGITVSQQSQRGIVANNTCINNDTAGICIGSTETKYAKDIIVRDNVIMNNGRNRDGNRPPHSLSGIILNNAQSVGVSGNILGDDKSQISQQYGVSIKTSKNCMLGPDVVSGTVTKVYNLDGPGSSMISQAASALLVK